MWDKLCTVHMALCYDLTAVAYSEVSSIFFLSSFNLRSMLLLSSL